MGFWLFFFFGGSSQSWSGPGWGMETFLDTFWLTAWSCWVPARLSVVVTLHGELPGHIHHLVIWGRHMLPPKVQHDVSLCFEWGWDLPQQKAPVLQCTVQGIPARRESCRAWSQGQHAPICHNGCQQHLCSTAMAGRFASLCLLPLNKKSPVKWKP